MRKIFTNFKAMMAAVVAMAVVAGAVSCTYDDTALWKEIDKIKKEVEQMRADLDNVLSIVNELESGDLAIRDVKQQGDGSQLLTLSNGKQITIYPKGGGLTNVITVYVEDDVRYWAMYDSIGNVQPIYVNGELVPVADLTPLTQVNDGAIEVSFDGGNTWYTTGYEESITDTIITNVEVVYSDWQTDADGNPLGLYCVVTFADGATMKVGMQNGKLVLGADAMFVSYGNRGEFYAKVQDAADYMIQVPEGWACDVDHNAKQERMILAVTAPSLEAINAGEAESSAIIKLMVVFNNGSSAIASLRVSTNPATVEFSTKGLYLEAGYGANYLVGALVSKSAYENNLASYLTIANQHLAGTTSTQIHDFSFMETSSLYVEYTDLITKLTAGNEYYFWYAAPNTDEEGNLYIEMKDIFAVKYKHVAPTLKLTKANFFDLDVTLTVTGADDNHKYALGYCRADEFNAEEIAAYYTDEPDYLNANRSDTEYKGSFLSLVNSYEGKLDPNTQYVMWYVNEASLPIVRAEEVQNWTLKTAEFTQGGSLEVSVSDVVVEYTSVGMTLNSEGHIAMYYNLMPANQASAYPTDEYAIPMLIESGNYTYNTDPVKVEFTGSKPGTKFTLFAVAVDADGKYGKVYKENYSTKAFVYNDLTPALELKDQKIDNTRVAVTCEGAVKYAYIYIQTNSDEWNKTYEGSLEKVGQFMIEKAGDSRICDTSDEKYALVDGHICLANLTMGAEYILIVMAVDADDVYSTPVAITFKPIANIGTVVKRDDPNWAVGKPTITVIECEDIPNLFLMFGWEFVPGENTKAYSAAMFPGNFFNDDLGTEIDTVDELIADLISSCDTGKMSEQGKSGVWQESGIYIREWTEWEDTDDDGYLENVEKSEERSGIYHFFPYGASKSTFIYTTWVGEDGNFHEPFAIDPATGLEVDIWTGAAL